MADQLCQACITGEYPTACGQKLAEEALEDDREGIGGRTYEHSGVRG